MWLCAGLSRGEFALLARPRATVRANHSLYLFNSRLLGLHACWYTAVRNRKTVNFALLTGIVGAKSPFYSIEVNEGIEVKEGV
jgi:hypothetical protein